MSARFRDVTCDRAAEGSSVGNPNLVQGEACISSNRQKQWHEGDQKQAAQQQKDLEA